MTTHSKTKSRIRQTPGFSKRNPPLPRGRGVGTGSTNEELTPEVVASGIRWITDRELALASLDLRRLKRIGRQMEQRGDYFGSGNLAYQLRQIASEIQALARGANRVRGGN